MIRFRARYKHGKYFDWDFGDGTRSEEEQPLKAYARPGEYEVSLTVSIDNTCSRTIRLEKPLIVK
jgi:PKD repeat protein